MKIKKLVALLLSFAMMVPSSVFAADEKSKEDDFKLTILYTNDIHTYINKDLNYASIAEMKDELEAAGENVMLVDAGDHIQGTAFGKMDEGHTIIELMNEAGYDIATFGNHEFDYDMQGALWCKDNADFPYVSCNFYDLATNDTVVNPYEVFEFDGVKVAFVGVTTPETYTKSTPAYFMNDDQTEFIYDIHGGNDGAALYADVQAAVNAAHEEADYVIILGHLGDDPSSAPWRSEDVIANVSGIDAFIDGHSHSTVEHKEVTDKDGETVVLTQTGCYFDNIGKMTITEDGIDTELINKDEYNEVYNNAQDETVKATEDAWIEDVNNQLGDKIAESEQDFYIYDPETGNRLIRSQETNQGDFAADSIYYLFNEVEGLDCDVAIMNGGGIRVNTTTGDWSYNTCMAVHPFGNVECLMEVTGQQILDALEWGSKSVGAGENGGFLQVAGMTYEINTAVESTVQKNEEGIWIGGPTGDYRVQNVKIYNKETASYEPLDVTKTYTLGGTNYTLRNLGDGFDMFDGATLVKDYVSQDYLCLATYASAFTDTDGNGYANVTTANSPLASYENYKLDYSTYEGSGRIKLTQYKSWVDELEATGSAVYGDYTVEQKSDDVYHIHDTGYSNPSSTYLVLNGDDALLIDASNGTSPDDFKTILDTLVEDRDLSIAITHNHGDHTGLLTTGIFDADTPVYISSIDYNASTKSLMDNAGLTNVNLLEEGDEIKVGDLTIEASYLIGHTEGSMVYYLESEQFVFTGDEIGSGFVWMLFTDDALTNYEKGLNQLAEHVADWDNLVILPGHAWQASLDPTGNGTPEQPYSHAYIQNQLDILQAMQDETTIVTDYTATCPWYSDAVQVTADGIPSAIDTRTSLINQYLIEKLSYTDVDYTKWFAPYVYSVTKAGLMTGKNTTTFDPYGTMTRGQVATVLYRMAGEPEVEYKGTFSDVPDGKFYSEAIEWAYAEGVITGYKDGTFKPAQAVTRQELAVMLYKYAGGSVSSTDLANLNTYPDAKDVSSWAKEAMAWAVANKIITGDQGKLNPKGTATRGQAAKMITVAKETIENMYVRQTEYGSVKGTEVDGVEVYYGVSYGKEPVGELRWAAPEDPDAWTETKDCTVKEQVALQATSGTDANGNSITYAKGTTDSLNLDIYTTTEAENCPVIVYVHGGNNQTGSSFDIAGNDMVLKDGVVYVSINYRLGLLGFNCLPSLLDEENNTGNFAMLDIAKSLQWVRDNIENFGGDPENVTVTGFSAGGRDVMAMLISPIFEGLFDKAIAYSGGMTTCTEEQGSQKIAETIAPLAVEDGKCATVEEATEWLLQDNEEVKEYLYSIEDARLVCLFPNAGIRMAKFPHLFEDDVVIPKGGFTNATYVNDVPLIMLTGSEEFTMFGNFDSSISSMKDSAAVVDFLTQYGGDFYRTFNTTRSAEKMDSYQSNIYLCQINYGDRNSEYPIAAYGAFHGIFVPAIDSSSAYSGIPGFDTDGYRDLAKIYNEYLTSFVNTGVPTSESANVEWKTWQESKEDLVLDAADGKALVSMEDVNISNEEIIQNIVNDPLDEEDKLKTVQGIMNGRWFSEDLDNYFNTPSLW